MQNLVMYVWDLGAQRDRREGGQCEVLHWFLTFSKTDAQHCMDASATETPPIQCAGGALDATLCNHACVRNGCWYACAASPHVCGVLGTRPARIRSSSWRASSRTALTEIMQLQRHVVQSVLPLSAILEQTASMPPPDTYCITACLN